MIEQQERIPDLVVNRCPVSCDDCKSIYLNKQILHRIICRCRCHSLTEDKLEQEDRLQNASLIASPEPEIRERIDPVRGECSCSHYYRIAVKQKIAENIARIGLTNSGKRRKL
jgi:hypothetical protein